MEFLSILYVAIRDTNMVNCRFGKGSTWPVTLTRNKVGEYFQRNFKRTYVLFTSYNIWNEGLKKLPVSFQDQSSQFLWKGFLWIEAQVFCESPGALLCGRPSLLTICRHVLLFHSILNLISKEAVTRSRQIKPN